MAEAAAPGVQLGARVNAIDYGRPWLWLAAGWHDLRSTASVSLAYGALFVLAGFGLSALLWWLDGLYLLPPIAAGFMLVAPILAVGLYEISRRNAAGEKITLATPLLAWRRNFVQVALLGLVLMLFFLAWMRLATMIFALFFGRSPAALTDFASFVTQVFLAPESLAFLVVGTAVGAVLSALAFAISAISAPMLLDREVDVVRAIATSVAAVRRNPGPMLLWAVLIVLFAGAGLVSLYVGLAVTLPLLGHATWYAYRDLVEPEAAKRRRPSGAGRGARGSP